MDEKMRILKMIEDGTITAAEAAALMKTMGVDEADEESGVLMNTAVSYDKKMFRVIVDSAEGDKVNIQFPVGAIKKILKVTGKLPIQDENLKGIDLSEMMEAVSQCLSEEVEGDFVNVKAADGTTVRIFVDK